MRVSRMARGRHPARELLSGVVPSPEPLGGHGTCAFLNAGRAAGRCSARPGGPGGEFCGALSRAAGRQTVRGQEGASGAGAWGV